MKKFLKENWFLIFTLVYVLSPVDLVPEFLVPLLGPFIYTDDVSLLMIELVRRIMGKKKHAITEGERVILEGEEVK